VKKSTSLTIFEKHPAPPCQWSGRHWRRWWRCH